MITTAKENVLCTDRVVSSAQIPALECERTQGKSLVQIKTSIGPKTEI